MPLLASSLALSFVGTLLFLAAPPGLGPLGPFVAGLLAVLGHRRIRNGGGTEREHVLSRTAMTLALVLMAHQAWILVQGAEVRIAQGEVRRVLSEVESTLRTGTAEGAWLLLEPPADAADATSKTSDAPVDNARTRWIQSLRETQATLGALVDLGPPTLNGGDEGLSTAKFRENPDAEARFAIAYAKARFQRGQARVEVDVKVRKVDGRIGATATRLEIRRDTAPR